MQLFSLSSALACTLHPASGDVVRSRKGTREATVSTICVLGVCLRRATGFRPTAAVLRVGESVGGWGGGEVPDWWGAGKEHAVGGRGKCIGDGQDE